MAIRFSDKFRRDAVSIATASGLFIGTCWHQYQFRVRFDDIFHFRPGFLELFFLGAYAT